MIKFFIKLFIFSLILGSISIVLSLIDYKYPEVTKHQIILDQFLSKIDSIESVAVGHSHNISLDFSTLGENGYHLWFSGSDVFETLYVLKIITPRMPNLKKIYMPLALNALEWDNALRDEAGKNKRRTIYQLFPSLSLIDNDYQNYLMAHMYRLARDDYWEKIIMSLITLSDQTEKMNNNIFYIAKDGAHLSPRYKRVLNLEELEKRFRKEVNDDINMEDNDTSIKNLDIEIRVKATIIKIRDHLNNAEIDVVFFTSPFYIDYFKNIDQVLANEMRDFMNGLVKDNPANYYDFSQDSLFSYDHELFYGYTHMNTEGAKKFSLYFADIMSKSEAEIQ